jgi:hypothetical protein
VYLFTINRPVAIIIVTLTSLGFALYLFLLVSAMVSPDSPFQTPITLFLARVIALILETLKPWGIKLREFVGRVLSRFRLPAADAETLPSFSSKAAIWPSWNLTWAESMLYAPAFDRRRSNYFPPQSPEVPAVLWVLETSTDPAIITAAAEIAADLQWPLNLDLEVPMTRVAQTFSPCLDRNFSGTSVAWTVREGMTHRALICSRAYFTFRLITQASSITLRTEPYIYFGDIDPIATDQDPSELGSSSRLLSWSEDRSN